MFRLLLSDQFTSIPMGPGKIKQQNDMQKETHKKDPYAICGHRRSTSACAYAQADQDLRCPLTESMEPIVYVDEQECPDQTAQMRKLIWTFAIRK